MQQLAILVAVLLLSVVATALKVASAPKKSEFSRSVFLKKLSKVMHLRLLQELNCV